MPISNFTRLLLLRKLGYDYVDGVVEKQDKFLKRMSGIARLYVALLIARPPQSAPASAGGGGGGSGRLGVRHLWRWLAATVNLGKIRGWMTKSGGLCSVLFCPVLFC